MESVIQISMQAAATLVVGFLAVLAGGSQLLLRQFHARIDQRFEAAEQTARTERGARASEMRDLRSSIAIESRRVGTLSEQIGALLEVDKRLRVIEEWRRHVPTADDIDEVKTMVGGVSAQLAAIEERSLATGSAVTRIENYLLERK